MENKKEKLAIVPIHDDSDEDFRLSHFVKMPSNLFEMNSL